MPEIRPADACGDAPDPYFSDESGSFVLYQGDSFELIDQLGEEQFDLVFADPPYFLSNGGVTCKSGKMVSVNKGDWDKSQGPQANHAFNVAWLEAIQRALKPHGSIFVSGTHHTIYSVGYALQKLGFKLLNNITWVKPNPPPNLSCRYFTHATETILWAARDEDTKHKFNYQEMKEENGGKQMKSVWRFLPPRKREKKHGKHPTQKPLPLLDRLVRSASDEGDRILDPFNGSGTTGLAALQNGRRYVGIEQEEEYLELTMARYRDLVPEVGAEQKRALEAAAS